ncbi:MAG: tetratricopeptide repeat protein [Planctomycetes bacterium]|nr:tetratricopeptide repeat protein [Planctomycetota bacterium]
MSRNSYTDGDVTKLTTKGFWLGLFVICVVALGLRLAILQEFLQENPIAEEPWIDSQVYWDMAGRMAEGHWTNETPFLSAPLYPYFLGVVRRLDGGLRSVYSVQLALHLLTVALIAWTASLRFGRLAGLLAAGLFVALTEPAVSSTRILGNTLQLLLVTLVWWRWSVLAEREKVGWADVGACGALLGLFALSYPAAIMLGPLFGLWLWWKCGWRAAGLGRVGVAIAAMAVVIAPATLHNLVVFGELIPITGHAGVTLRQGNGPEAQGVYSVVPGISATRGAMHADAAAAFAKAHGREGSWREIDWHFRRQVLSFWTENPGRTCALFARKAYWFLSGYRYDDIAPPVLEREFGVGERALLAPLATPWLLGAALAGLLVVLRRPLRFAPEWLLLAMSLVVVVLFFYSPRYRLPALPVCCALAALALTQLRRLGYPRVIAVGLVAAPLVLYFVNLQTGFDNLEQRRQEYSAILSTSQTRVGDMRWQAGDVVAAERRYRAALAAVSNSAPAHRRLGALLVQLGRPQEAIPELLEAIKAYPTSFPGYSSAVARTCRHLYAACVGARQYAAAVYALRQALGLQPDEAEFHLALAWLLATCPDERARDGAKAVEHAVKAQQLTALNRPEVLDVLAAAYAEVGRFEEAQVQVTSALTMARRQNDAKLAEELEQRLAQYRAGQPCRAAPRTLASE